MYNPSHERWIVLLPCQRFCSPVVLNLLHAVLEGLFQVQESGYLSALAMGLSAKL